MESGAYTSGQGEYPLTFSVEYPDRDLDRVTTGFRIIVAIPILILLAALGRWRGPAGTAARGSQQEVVGFFSSRCC